MAQKRMLNKSISVSEQVADLPEKTQLFFTWSIAHADDFGILPISSRKLKGLVIPYWDILSRGVEEMITEILEAKLWSLVEFEGQRWFCFPKWFDYQDLRRDVTPKLYANVKAKWDDYELVKKQFRNDPSQNVTDPSEIVHEDRIDKGKLGKDRLEEESNSLVPTSGEVGTKEKKLNYSEEDRRLTELLYSLIKSNFSFVKEKNPKQKEKDYAEMNRLHRIDGRSYQEIELIIRFSQADEFWKQNIRSVSKLRKQFETLMVKAHGQAKKRIVKDYDK